MPSEPTDHYLLLKKVDHCDCKGENTSLLFLTSTPSSQSWAHERLIWLKQSRSRALNLALYIALPEVQQKDTVRYGTLGALVQVLHRQRTTAANLDCTFVENAFIFIEPKINFPSLLSSKYLRKETIFFLEHFLMNKAVLAIISSLFLTSTGTWTGR